MEKRILICLFLTIFIINVLAILYFLSTKDKYKYKNTITLFGNSINNNNMAPASINNMVSSMGSGHTTTPKGPGRNWCENLGGKLKEGQCVFPSWDDCVKGLQCKTDPSEVHLDWYNADKSKNYDDVSEAMINGEMEIVDVCHPANTSWNSNPRCKIKNGLYKGKTGVCVYDGEQVQPCQAVGQGCTAKLDEFCPGHCGDPFSGNVVEQHLMCRKTRNKNGEQEVSAVCAY